LIHSFAYNVVCVAALQGEWVSEVEERAKKERPMEGKEGSGVVEGEGARLDGMGWDGMGWGRNKGCWIRGRTWDLGLGTWDAGGGYGVVR
jgi:hypothetical protein